MRHLTVSAKAVGIGMTILLLITSAADADLLGYWSANSTSGQGTLLPNDQGNSDLDGELVEASYTSDMGGHTGQAGDYAMQFDGFDEDYAVIPPTEEEFEAITITAWVNGIPNGAWAGLVSSRADPQSIYLGFQGATTDLAYVWNDNSGDTWGWVSGVPIIEEEWTFVALTINEEMATLYAGGKGEDLVFDVNEIEHFAQENLGEWRFSEDDCCGTERNFSGLMDDVSIWNEALSTEQIMELHAGSATPLTLAGIGGDPLAPLDNGTLTDPQERADYVHNVLKTWIGDANVDGEFNSSDFVAVFQPGEYEDSIVDNSSWGTGDWNGDKDFDSSDFVSAFQDGGYELGPRPANPVPEPSCCLLMALGMLSLSTTRRLR